MLVRWCQSEFLCNSDEQVGSVFAEDEPRTEVTTVVAAVKNSDELIDRGHEGFNDMNHRPKLVILAFDHSRHKFHRYKHVINLLEEADVLSMHWLGARVISKGSIVVSNESSSLKSIDEFFS